MDGLQVLEAPVVTGASDRAALSTVFGVEEIALVSRMNPYIELQVAAQMRDRVCHRFLVKPAALAGQRAKGTLSRKAQMQMRKDLLGRGWSVPMVMAYLAVPGREPG